MRRNPWTVIGILALLLAFFVQPVPSTSANQGTVLKAAKGQIPQPVINTGTVRRTAPLISSSIMVAALDEVRAEEGDQASGNDGNLSLSAPSAGSPGTLGCGGRDKGKGNERVNQDCTYRRQAEEDITYNPADPTNLTAGQNDSRVGFNQCGVDWSTDQGHHWGDMLPPFRQKINYPPFQENGVGGDPNRNTITGSPGTFHTYDAASDPVVAMDNQGNAYFSCVAFDVFSNASMLFVVHSPAGADGSFYYNISTVGRRYIVNEDNSPDVFNDKEWITVDKYPSSPNQGNVYVTWTLFRFSPACGPQPTPPASPVEQYCSSPIFGSMSTDQGHTWSTPEEISGTSAALCFFGNAFDPNRSPQACDFNQGSNPTTLPNGDLEVIFNNGNTAADNPNAQQLGVHCHPTGSSTAGTANLNCAAPAKVGDDVSSGEPLCDFGRGPEECVPGAYIRTNDYPRINQNAYDGHLYAVWQDYRNGEYDIQMSQSLDGGLTWHEVGTVNPDRGLDHYFPAVELSPTSNQDRAGVSYYRTTRVPTENTTPAGGFGCPPGTTTLGPFLCSAGTENSDYVLAGGTAGQTPYAFKVISPTFAPPDGIQSGFNGDYSGLTINKGEEAHPIWSDTRNTNPYPENGVVHDEDIFTDNVGLPNGNGNPSVGQIGHN